MLDLIQQITKENLNEFIKKYGKITDKDIAKQLLCITSNAWLVLDESLKTDSEIIMHYQPMGSLYVEITGEIFENREIFYLPQKGFNVVGNIQIPQFELPENFDIESYVAVQKELTRSYEAIQSYDVDLKRENSVSIIMKNVEFEGIDLDRIISSNKPFFSVNTNYKFYNRSKLPNIIQNIYLKPNTKKIKVK